MSELKLKLLSDAVMIQMKRDKITAEIAVAKYALGEEEKAAVLAAVGGAK